MSTLQRKIQQESRSNSRVRSGGNSRQSSRSSSKVGSRVHSDDEDDYTSNSFLTTTVDAEALAQTLDGLVTDEQGSKDKFSESLEMLNYDQRKTSLEAREKALLAVLSVLTVKYYPERITEYALDQFSKALRTGRSDLEKMLSLQALCVCAATDIEASAEHVQANISRILETISNEEASVTVRANFAFGYALLRFFMLYGAGDFKKDEYAMELIEIADGYSDNVDEASIASGCILGAGLIASTMTKINPAADDTINYLAEMLDKPSVDVKLAAGKVIAMFYQLYDYDDDNEEESIPMVDQDELLYKLQMLVSESTKKVHKRDKREQKSLFRDVVRTINAYSTVESRNTVTQEDVTITHIKLARSRSISIDTWNKLILVQMYKWLFGPGVHIQIVSNPFIKETIDDTSLVDAGGYDDKWGDDNDAANDANLPLDRQARHKHDDMQRQRNIQKLRSEKVQKQMDEVVH